jgi:TRAP-type C4-dicarboxylate transport system permease small subunit
VGIELVREYFMNAQKLVAVVLLIAGGLTLIYGGFSYTKETHSADVGSLHMSVDETRHVNVPVWAGIGALVAGGLLLTMGRKS